MPRRKPLVVLGLLGATLDLGGSEAKRWHRWRPSVDLCRHEDLVIDRFELLWQPGWEKLADVTARDMAQVSPETKVRTQLLAFEDPWDFEGVYAALLDYVEAYPFAPEREDYLVHITTGTHVAQICWFLLLESHHIPGRLIQTSPPPRGTGDVGTYRIIDLDLSKYDLLASRSRKRQQEGQSFLKAGIATKNPVFNRLIAQIEHVVLRSQAPVLLTGPTGAGKTALARRIYELQHQRQQVRGRFVELNCATLRGDAAMSMLFGHRKGAFTGAIKDRPGLLKEADGGVLFLDEIGELGLDEQAMLLRAIEDKRFLPVGSDAEESSAFTLIAGSNRDLRARVREGAFREDLLARLDLWTFELPGLAQRPEDIPPNLDYELRRNEEREGSRVTFNKEARELFLRFATSPEATWTGNFRDFSAAVERMATLADGGRITADVVEAEIARLRQRWSEPAGRDSSDSLVTRTLGEDAVRELDRFDRVQLEDVLAVCLRSTSLSDAGRTLFAASRQTKSSSNDADRLRKYLAKFGLRWQDLHA